MLIRRIYTFFLLGMLLACEKETDLPDQPVESYTKIYMPQAVVNPSSYVLKITDSLQFMTYSASYGGQDYPGNDVEVTFMVNNSLIDSFNQVNGTHYAILPGKSYTLSHTSAVIPAGQLSTGPLSISVKTSGADAMDILTDYLLPVSIGKAGEKVNDNLRTAFFKVRTQPELNDYPPYDRSAFSVIDFSSQEANGEGPENGRALFILDDNTSTFWHTQWQGASPGPPHYVTIDMGAVKTVHGLYFLARQGNESGKPKDIQVMVSTDNTAWTNAGEFTLANTKDLQWQFTRSFIDARYVKVIVQNSYNASYTHLAELKIF
jgi:hypothetical protein